MLKIKELLAAERRGFCFDVQSAARGEGPFLTREGLSQRIWDTSLSFRVINIRMVFFKRELGKSHMSLRNSMYLTRGFKKYCLQIDILLKWSTLRNGELCFCAKLWVGTLDYKTGSCNGEKLSWSKEKSGSWDVLLVTVPDYLGHQCEKPLKHRHQEKVWWRAIGCIRSKPSRTRRTCDPTWFGF